MRIKNPHDIVKFLFYWIKKKRKNSYRYTHVHTYIHTFPYFSRSCTVTQFIYGTPITRWKGYPMERHATHTHVYIYTYIAGNDSMANSFSPATMEIESARDSAFWLMESVALRKKRIKVRAEIINFFLGFVAERSFNQDHPEPRPSSEDDGWLIKRRRRLPRISTPIHRPWRRVNRPALASPEGTAFKAATDHPLSPPLPPWATKENWPRGCAPRGRKDSTDLVFPRLRIPLENADDGISEASDARLELFNWKRRVSVLIVFSDRFFLPEIPLSQLPSRIWISLI